METNNPNIQLRQDRAGDFILATGLPDVAGEINPRFPRLPLRLQKVHEEAKPSPGRYEGWVMKVTRDGRMTPLASGFRAAAGVGVSPAGDIFITDQQGDYIATSTLVHVQSGKFYGHAASLKWRDDYRGPVDLEALTKLRTPEAVALPHGTMGGSPGEPVWDTTGGKFGPFAGQVFIGDFTKLISRVFLEKVAGEYQGACFPFVRDAVGLAAIQANRGADNLTIPAGKDGLKYFRDVPPRIFTPPMAGPWRTRRPSTRSRACWTGALSGPMSRPLVVVAPRADIGPDVANGRRIYGTFCVICHQADGKGGALPGAAATEAMLVAANFTLRGKDAPLSKPDSELLKTITDGAPGKPMPPFGGVLQPGEIRDVLAYLRTAFGDAQDSHTDPP